MALTLSDLTRTLSTFFRFGTLRVKDSSGALHMRNGGDTAFVDGVAKRFKVMGNNAANGVIFDVPDALAGNVTFKLPSADGASGYLLGTDGSGALGFYAPGGGAGAAIEEEAFSQATGSPLTIATLAANEVVTGVYVTVSSPAAGGSPTLAIGIVGDTGAIVATTEIDLKEAGTYIKFPNYQMASQAAVIATIVTSGQTFSGKIRLAHTSTQ